LQNRLPCRLQIPFPVHDLLQCRQIPFPTNDGRGVLAVDIETCLEGGLVRIGINNTKWKPGGFHCFFKRPDSVARVVCVIEIIGVFLEPLVRIGLIERYARLKYIDQRVPFVGYGLIDDLLGHIRIADKGPCNK
jgi:hypothetical protein